MAQETGVQLKVKSYQRLKKWYLIPTCLTLGIIRYVSRVEWSSPVWQLLKREHLVTNIYIFQCVFYWLKHLWNSFQMLRSCAIEFLLMSTISSNLTISSLGNKKKLYRGRGSGEYGEYCMHSHNPVLLKLLFRKYQAWFHIWKKKKSSASRFDLVSLYNGILTFVGSNKKGR